MRKLTLAAGLLAAIGWIMAAPDAVKGKAVWEKNCLKCHGADGKGNEKIAKMLKLDMKLLDLTRADVKNKPDADLKKVVEDGKEKMPGYKKDKKLTDAEITDSVAFLRTLVGPAAPAAK